MAILTGNAKGIQDSIIGTASDDVINGLSGDDVLRGGRGNDTIIGGAGSDVLVGGLDADTFEWSAGHITAGATDWITDFSLLQGDSLFFRASGGGQNIEIVSVTKEYLNTLSVAAGGSDSVSLDNNVATGHDVTFVVRNTVTGAEQKIVLMDAWSGALATQWDEYLTSLGTGFTASV